MHRQPLRDLCPRAVVVWRDGAARCDQCGRRVNRSSSSAPWAHVPDWLDDRLEELEDIVAGELNAELDRLLHPAEPTHVETIGALTSEDAARYSLDLLRRGYNLEVFDLPDGPVTVAPGAKVYVGDDPATRVEVGGITSAEAIDGDLTFKARLGADAARALGLDPDIEGLIDLATDTTTEEP